MGVLDGVRVLELGTALAAPYAAMMLADLGAAVVKVEKPKRGDLTRFADDYVHGTSGYFLGINRGKRSLAIDLRTSSGQDVVRRLCRDTDVVIANFRPSVMAEWGLSYDDLKEVRPDIVYCSISAFGEIRGLEHAAGNDLVAQAHSGLMSLTGEADRQPVKAGAPVTDVAAACMGTIAILAALLRRQADGRGAEVTTSLLEAAYALMPNLSPCVLNGSPAFHRMGSAHPQLAPYEAYETSDGEWMVLGVFHQDSWVKLCTALELESLVDDERFCENRLRVKNRDVLYGVIAERMAPHDADSWSRRFQAHGVPFSRVLSLEKSLEQSADGDPDMFVDDLPSCAGSIRMLRAPFTIDGVRPCHPRGAPGLGEHNSEVLSEIGETV